MLNFEAVCGAALASRLAMSTCTQERCSLCPGHTMPSMVHLLPPSLPAVLVPVLTTTSEHWAACVAYVPSTRFLLLSPVLSPRQRGNTLGAHRRACTGRLCPAGPHLRHEGGQPWAHRQRCARAMERDTQVLSMAEESPELQARDPEPHSLLPAPHSCPQKQQDPS